MGSQPAGSNKNYTDTVKDMELPSSKTVMHAVKIAVMDDKPIMLDYWNDSLNKEVFIGIKEDNEKMLVKNEEEYTSLISKIFKVESSYIIITENSIYLVKSDIATRKIS